MVDNILLENILYPFVSILLSSMQTGIILHSSLRTPNLKARLNTFREEFRAVWKRYGEF